MKEILDLIHELRCDIHNCEVSGENDTEINDANETLAKLEELVTQLKISKSPDRFKLAMQKYGYNSEFRKEYDSLCIQLRHDELDKLYEKWDVPNIKNIDAPDVTKSLFHITNNAWDLPDGVYQVGVDKATNDYAYRVWLKKGINDMIIVAEEHNNKL